MRKSYLKIGILLIGILTLTTNCEKDETQIYPLETATINSTYSLPGVNLAKENFERSNNFINPFDRTNFSAKGKKEKFFIDWEHSRTVNFKKNVDILYTPIIYHKKGKRTKSFVASVTNENNEVESRLFSLFYDKKSTNKAFSGFIIKYDINGSLLEIYNYKRGVQKTKYRFKKSNNSKNDSKNEHSLKTPICIEMTPLEYIEWMWWLMEVNEMDSSEEVENSFELWDCVVMIGQSDDGTEYIGDYYFFNDDWDDLENELSGGEIPLGDFVYYTNVNSFITVQPPQWWNEEGVYVSPENMVATDLVDALGYIGTLEKDWINNPDNFDAVLDLYIFLYANEFSSEAEIFSLLVIDTYKNGSGDIALFAMDAFMDGAETFAADALMALMDGGTVDFNEAYIETNTPDDSYLFQGTKQLISNPLTLSNGDIVSVKFGTTKSDNLSANQQVSIDLVDGIKFAIEEANTNLSAADKITSIYIMATSNGKHSASSNHSNGTAVDISRINGNKMAVTGNTDQVRELQKAFDNYTYIRENFGPHFKHKYTKSTNTWNYSYSISGHKDHIHVSVRR